MKVAILTTDNREHHKDYAAPLPRFGISPEALLQGFAQLLEMEVHVVSCTPQPLAAPEKTTPEIFITVCWRQDSAGCGRSIRAASTPSEKNCAT